ncbi:MAG: hypothetical protein EA400_16070 [Chromatiaceae bacterium]|nr:MAG: hypothetical protein EA400_16070 [Chromatiaceae bacterium]
MFGLPRALRQRAANSITAPGYSAGRRLGIGRFGANPVQAGVRRQSGRAPPRLASVPSNQ